MASIISSARRSKRLSRQPKQNDGFERTPTREIPAWAISLGVHLAILFLLGTYTLPKIMEMQSNTITSVIDEEIEAEDYKFDAVAVDQVGNDSSVNNTGFSQSTAQQVSVTPHEQVEQKLDEQNLEIKLAPVAAIAMPSEAEFADTIEVQGTSDQPGGIDGSVDRLTIEIAATLKEGKTLVVWMFDESGSMKERREAIADRFENVYKQLDMFKVRPDKALKTGIVGFSDKTTFYTPEPIDDVAKAASLVRGIGNSKSPKENVFQAVKLVMSRWSKYRTAMHRNMMIIIVTDERGDDIDLVEEVATTAARHGIRCYCVGNASVFGRPHGFMKYTYPDGYTINAKVDQGPETSRPERLDLPFWGTGSRDLRQMTAGYGPYALTRLCAESKGMYLIAKLGGRYKFDPVIMRNYAPDYRPKSFYERDLKNNRAKAMLVKAAELSFQGRPSPPQTVFRGDNDNVLRNAVTEAQKPWALMDARLINLEQILSAGEKDRDKVKSARWRAGYDLAMGRLLAMRVRAFGYRNVMASMKTNLKSFENKGSNTWELVPAKEIVAGGPKVRKLAKDAKKYLARVIKEHPGTPWELLAERELSEPMGWQWTEKHVAYAMTGRGEAMDPKMQIQFAEEEKKKAAQRRMASKKRSKPPL